GLPDVQYDARHGGALWPAVRRVAGTEPALQHQDDGGGGRGAVSVCDCQRYLTIRFSNDVVSFVATACRGASLSAIEPCLVPKPGRDGGAWCLKIPCPPDRLFTRCRSHFHRIDAALPAPQAQDHHLPGDCQDADDEHNIADG